MSFYDQPPKKTAAELQLDELRAIRGDLKILTDLGQALLVALSNLAASGVKKAKPAAKPKKAKDTPQ